MPARVLKIDQAFVRNLTDRSSREFALVQTVLSLSHQLGYRVVAEGVETIETAELLQMLGCDEAQGYHFARPLEAAHFDEWMAEHHRDLADRKRAA